VGVGRSSGGLHVSSSDRKIADHLINAGIGASALAICGFAFLHDTAAESVAVVLLVVPLLIGGVMFLAGLVGSGVIRLRRRG